VKAVILTNDAPNQAALCRKLAEHCRLNAVVLSRNVPMKSPPPGKRLSILLNRIEGRIVGRPFIRAWLDLQDRYAREYGGFPQVPTVRVRNINDPETLAALTGHEPDLVIVSGTNLVGKRIIESAAQRLGIINMHTGISPYVKGGPNCTNWCLARRWFYLIGSTVMWLDSGIDSGAIVATEQTPLDGSESLAELHWKVMEHAQDLYVRVVQALAAGESVPRIAQPSVCEGHTFYTQEWTGTAMRTAWKNFRSFYRPGYFQSREFAEANERIKLFPFAAHARR